MIRKWFYIANSLNVGDALTTLWFAQLGIPEGNPIMAILLTVHPIAFLAIKLGVFAMVSIVCAHRGWVRYLKFASLLYGGACIWNLIAIIMAS